MLSPKPFLVHLRLIWVALRTYAKYLAYAANRVDLLYALKNLAYTELLSSIWRSPLHAQKRQMLRQITKMKYSVPFGVAHCNQP